MGLRDQILNAEDLQEEILAIPEWKCDVLVRALTGEQRAQLLQQALLPNGRPDLTKLYPLLAIVSTLDPDTKELVFSLADRDQLNKKSGAALDRIANVAMRINGLGDDALGIAEKNSATPTASGGSTLS